MSHVRAMLNASSLCIDMRDWRCPVFVLCSMRARDAQGYSVSFERHRHIVVNEMLCLISVTDDAGIYYTFILTTNGRHHEEIYA